jgi:hypothetical protein
MVRESHAALFGIEYINSDAELPGCENDVRNMGTLLLEDAGYDVVHVYTEQETPQKVTRMGIESVLWELIATSYMKNLENVWIHFSGHGGGVKDELNGDEKDGQDEYFCPSDYVENGVFKDDQFGHMLKFFNPQTNIVCVFDSCNSGTMGDLPFTYTRSGMKVQDGEQHMSNVIMLSGCRDNQVSYSMLNLNGKNEYTGVMTSSLIECIRYRQQSGATMRVKTVIKDVHRLLKRRGFPQIPVITSSQPVDDETILIRFPTK